LLKFNLLSRINFAGFIVAIIMIIGLFGPWLTVSYDSYSKINPVTKLGEAYYHSRVELTPLFGSVYKDEILVEQTWFVSIGINVAGFIMALSAFLSILKYKKNWAHFSIFVLYIVGIVFFFMSLGEGISIGVFTDVGWGLKVTGLGVLILFLFSIYELSRNSITRFID